MRLLKDVKEHDVDAVIVGGGSTGLRVAYELAHAGLSAMLLERKHFCGEGQTLHNSGVIHAGIYYPPGSMRAAMCVEGNRLLFEYCERAGIPYRRDGKLIVAKDESELAALERLRLNALENGVRLEDIAQRELQEMEPLIVAHRALWSPTTAVVDQGALVQAYRRDAEEAGAMILTNTSLDSVAFDGDSYIINASSIMARKQGGAEVRHKESRGAISARYLINAAGAHADSIAAQLGVTGYEVRPCRGEYALLTPKDAQEDSMMVRRPVYGLPDPSGKSLGVHLTRTTSGAILVGPTADYLDGPQAKEGTGPNIHDVEYFHEEVVQYYPHVKLSQLRLDQRGERGLVFDADGKMVQDFVIAVQDQGYAKAVHAIGIPSPGFTASIPLGRHIASIILS